MEDSSKLDLDTSWHRRLQQEFSSARITDDEMCQSMKRVYDEFDYCIDPHTAVGVAAAEKLGYNLYDKNFDASVFAILSTASPCKFEESVTIGIGETEWAKYAEKSFPSRATSIIGKDEIEPILYQSIEGKKLGEVQMEWEKLARSIVAKF